jgi:hypothetical protein
MVYLQVQIEQKWKERRSGTIDGRHEKHEKKRLGLPEVLAHRARLFPNQVSPSSDPIYTRFRTQLSRLIQSHLRLAIRFAYESSIKVDTASMPPTSFDRGAPNHRGRQTLILLSSLLFQACHDVGGGFIFRCET